MKNISILFVAILLSYSTSAQDTKFEIGLQAGPNLTNVRYGLSTLQAQTATGIGWTAGLFFQYNISNTFSLRTDPAFEHLSEGKGDVYFTDTEGTVIGIGKMYFHYNYFSIPVLVRASFGNKLKFFVNAGPSLGFLFGQNSTSDFTTPQNNIDSYQTMNFGITSGLGVALPIKEKFSLSFELRNNLGLSNINVSSDPNNTIKTNTTSLLIGFSYKIGKGNATPKTDAAPKQKKKPKGTFSPTF